LRSLAAIDAQAQVRLRGSRDREGTRGSDMSDKLTPDNVFVEDGGENYEDLVNLSEDDG
jgi:hypothetical protein